MEQTAMGDIQDTARIGVLNQDQQEVFCRDLDAKVGSVQIYRELKPTRDTIEYTVYFRRESTGEKYRVDFDVDTQDIDVLSGLNEESLNASLAVTARAFARQAIREGRLATLPADRFYAK